MRHTEKSGSIHSRQLSIILYVWIFSKKHKNCQICTCIDILQRVLGVVDNKWDFSTVLEKLETE